MEFQKKPDSAWTYLLGGAAFVIIIAGFFMRGAGLSLVGIGVALVFAAGAMVLAHRTASLNNASFSRQLMDEYCVTSSRSLYQIEASFSDPYEANTVFTRDGVETSVLVKRLNTDRQKMYLSFNVLGDDSLYPKPSKQTVDV